MDKIQKHDPPGHDRILHVIDRLLDNPEQAREMGEAGYRRANRYFDIAEPGDGEAVVEALPKESFEDLIIRSEYTDYILAAKNLMRRWMGRSPTVLSPQQRAIAELRNARMEFVQPQQAPGIINITGKLTAGNGGHGSDDKRFNPADPMVLTGGHGEALAMQRHVGACVRERSEEWKQAGEFFKSHAVQALAIETAEGDIGPLDPRRQRLARLHRAELASLTGVFRVPHIDLPAAP